ncbi:MBL fold metallo-hydrolase [Gluconobacter japonicus]|uniref:MBL fold metallo-hydrolase n=1 Tax=Gluconobacter japonicus TaxID=376620 RepID=UPI0039ED1B91
MKHALVLDDNPLHFDGTRYFNPPSWRPDTAGPVRTPGQRFRNILKWQLSLRPRWPDALPPQTRHTLTAPAPGECLATFIGHATVLLQFGRQGREPLRIITDPVFSERCSPFRSFGPKRVRPPGIPLEALPPIDMILVSHCHYDHMDLPTLRVLAAKNDAVCISLSGNRRHLEKTGLPRIVELDWWEGTQAEGARITATPALHGSARTPFDQNMALWGGFMIEAEGKKAFFAGDTAWGRHFDAIHRHWNTIDLAILPIGAYEPRNFMRRVHMNPEEAVMAFDTLKPDQAIAIHFGTFQLTDEAILEPAARLEIASLDHPRRFKALENGETLTLPSSSR